MSEAEELPHWFAIPGRQEGRRTFEEQMLGLHPALAEVPGKTVVDFGCAEGLIAIEFAKAGAARVIACDYNAPMIETAKALADGVPNVEFKCVDIREIAADRAQRAAWRCDVLLALAVLHKMTYPQEALDFFADSVRDLFVVRLPRGSNGDHVKAKHGTKSCSVNFTMKRRGFVLEKTLTGPRQERVQYWRRRRPA